MCITLTLAECLLAPLMCKSLVISRERVPTEEYMIEEYMIKAVRHAGEEQLNRWTQS
jgi:hypothetical protein